jgi:hypothetical protein
MPGANKAVASAGYGLEFGIQDAPRPREILFALAAPDPMVLSRVPFF